MCSVISIGLKRPQDLQLAYTHIITIKKEETLEELYYTKKLIPELHRALEIYENRVYEDITKLINEAIDDEVKRKALKNKLKSIGNE